MAEAYIVDAVRTAGGKRGGKLAGWHPVDLAAATLDAIVARTGIDGRAVDDVIMGCVMQGGQQAGQVGRNAVLAAHRLPDSVPAVSIDRQCGSSQQSMQFAAQAVMSGTQDMIIAAGVESMTRVPMGSTALLFMKEGLGNYKSPRLEEKYPGIMFSQFIGAEMIVKKHGFSREQLDQYAYESHRRAAAATQAGAFDAEIIPLDIETPEGAAVHRTDEGIRYDATAQSIGTVKLLQEGGSISAANASQICDGASAVLIVSEAALKTHGLTPMARIHNLTVTAGDPVIMLEEPLFATDRALKRAGMRIDDNEAFAPVPMAWMKHTGGDHARLNVNGGAIALGHPLGASGTKLMATLVHALRARGGRYGLQTMCEGGGIANVTIIERL
jgi:acetyl-CoA C-acetyltransferase